MKTDIGDQLVEQIKKSVERRGKNVQYVLAGTRAFYTLLMDHRIGTFLTDDGPVTVLFGVRVIHAANMTATYAGIVE